MYRHTRSTSGPQNIKALPEERIIEGYASVFGVLDSHGDVVMKGAFSEFLSKLDDPGTVPMLFQHDASRVIGKHLELREDDRGLFFKAKVAPTAAGDEVLELVSGGFISGISIGFDIADSEIDADTGVRRLKSLNLWENSVVTFPSNDQARALSVRSALLGIPEESKARIVMTLDAMDAELRSVLDTLAVMREVITLPSEAKVEEVAPAEEKQEKEEPKSETPEEQKAQGFEDMVSDVELWKTRRLLQDMKNAFNPTNTGERT